MSRPLEGKVAIVTGAAKGIGKATATRLSADGAAVILTDIDYSTCEATAKTITELGGKCHAVEHDVAEDSSWAEVIRVTSDIFGGLAVLVSNAGIGTLLDIEEENVDGWNRMCKVNQRSVWLGMKHAVPRMRAGGGGSIVNVSSILGSVGGFGKSAAYHASKGAVTVLTKNAAIRYAEEGIRVNAVSPGFISVEREVNTIDQAGSDMAEGIIERTPMRRWGLPEEVAAAISFLTGPESSYITGIDLIVDGGWMAA